MHTYPCEVPFGQARPPPPSDSQEEPKEKVRNESHSGEGLKGDCEKCMSCLKSTEEASSEQGKPRDGAVSKVTSDGSSPVSNAEAGSYVSVTDVTTLPEATVCDAANKKARA